MRPRLDSPASQLRCVDDTRAVSADDEVQRLEMLFGRRHDHRLALHIVMLSSPMRLFQGTGGGLEIFGRLWGERADALTCVATRCGAPIFRQVTLRFEAPTLVSLGTSPRPAQLQCCPVAQLLMAGAAPM